MDGQGLLVLAAMMVLPLFDREWMKFLGLNRIDVLLGIAGEGQHELDPMYTENTGQQPVTGRDRRGGGDGGIVSGFVGFLMDHLVIILSVIILLGLLFSGIGVGVVSAVPVVGDYVPYLSDTAADRATPALQSDAAEDTFGTLRQARARVFCILKGPSCLRQWRLNNTQRPGSDEVGETYGLKIERFQVGQGKQLDVARYDREEAIPISYSISNTRHGLKGITAKDVKYRLRMIDSKHKGGNAYCDTGWRDVDGFDADGDGKDDDIYPGTAAFAGFKRLDSAPESGKGEAFTVDNCDLLQPALGEFRTVTLEVKYDYFSQATLYFDAMSLQHLTGNPNIQMPDKMKNSKTADTPVKAAVGVVSPVLYDQESGEPEPFSMGATVNTDEFDLKYKVENLTVTKSSRTRIAESEEGESRECSFKNENGDSLMLLTESAKSKIISGFSKEESKKGPGTGEKSGERFWFTRNNQPSIFGCRMELTETESISPSGETLTMGVETDYTVAIKEPIDNFKAFNSRCSRWNCPLLFAIDLSDLKGYGKRAIKKVRGKKLEQAYCDGVDAGNGCVGTTGFGKNPPDKREGIEQGDYAVRVDRDLRVSTGEGTVNLRGYIIGLDRGKLVNAPFTAESLEVTRTGERNGVAKYDVEMTKTSASGTRGWPCPWDKLHVKDSRPLFIVKKYCVSPGVQDDSSSEADCDPSNQVWARQDFASGNDDCNTIPDDLHDQRVEKYGEEPSGSQK